jgi:hypothetical protein
MSDFEERMPIKNALLNPDGSVQTFDGAVVSPSSESGSELYKEMLPIANKFLDPDDTVHTLDEIIGGGGGGVPEAPDDGSQYGRQSKGWTKIVGGSTITNFMPTILSSLWQIEGSNSSQTLEIAGLKRGDFVCFPLKTSNKSQSEVNFDMYEKLTDAQIPSDGSLTLTIAASDQPEMEDFSILIVQ